ncbi:hypothetical protein NEUTE2DRAFT_88323 [Neurospora tetrasperma FGSC 2509]|nr:hypothetical protein NEUTE2DRAFT_88323 [Neurospora tetrasperma FGSC 2509]
MKLIRGEGGEPTMIDFPWKGERADGARARGLPVHHLCRPGIGSRSSQQNASRQSAKDERNVTAPSSTTPRRPNPISRDFCAAQGDIAEVVSYPSSWFLMKESDSNVTADNGGDPRRVRTVY